MAVLNDQWTGMSRSLNSISGGPSHSVLCCLQLGSLVIALPSIHEGGELTIQHKERSHVFDWSLSELPTEPIVQWGAFYSDCKHEVHKIKSGARITVTYNLMAVKAASPPLKVCLGT